MPGHTIITYKGKRIYYFDHRGLSGQAAIDSVKGANEMLHDSPSSGLLTLADFTDAYADKAVMDYLKSEETKRVTAKVSKAAVLGISGLKKVLLNAYNLAAGVPAKAFDTEEAAKEYLVR